MVEDGLSNLLDEAFPRCPNDGTDLEDAGTLQRPYLLCPVCGLVVV